RERLFTFEEPGERFAQLGVEQNRLRPALACPQYVAVRKSAARYKATELLETCPACDEVGHVNVKWLEASAIKCRRYFHVAIHPLLSQYSHLRTRTFRNEWRGDIVISDERQLYVQARIVVHADRVEL